MTTETNSWFYFVFLFSFDRRFPKNVKTYSTEEFQRTWVFENTVVYSLTIIKYTQQMNILHTCSNLMSFAHSFVLVITTSSTFLIVFCMTTGCSNFWLLRYVLHTTRKILWYDTETSNIKIATHGCLVWRRNEWSSSCHQDASQCCTPHANQRWTTCCPVCCWATRLQLCIWHWLSPLFRSSQAGCWEAIKFCSWLLLLSHMQRWSHSPLLLYL